MVLSRLYSCRQSTRHSWATRGVSCKRRLGSSSGARPSAVWPEAMVPPVPIMRMFFISKLLVVHGGQAEAHRLLDLLLPPGVGGVIFLAKDRACSRAGRVSGSAVSPVRRMR